MGVGKLERLHSSYDNANPCLTDIGIPIGAIERKTLKTGSPRYQSESFSQRRGCTTLFGYCVAKHRKSLNLQTECPSAPLSVR